jgi:hypothetical protein
MSYDFSRSSDIDPNAYFEQPVHLLDFLAELKVAFAKYGGEPIITTPKGSRSSWVWRKGDITPMGTVQFSRPTSDNENDPWRYIIFAHTIRNARYSDYNPQYYSVTTTNKATAIKNALKYLRPMNNTEIVNETGAEAFGAAKVYVRGLTREASTMEHRAFQTTSLDAELKQLLLAKFRDEPHTFSQDMHVKLTNYIHTEHEEAEATQDIQSKKWVYVGLVNKTAEVLYVDVAKISSDTMNRFSARDVTWERMRMDEMPSELRGKVASMSIVENKRYVHGLGYRLDEGAFYVLS